MPARFDRSPTAILMILHWFVIPFYCLLICCFCGCNDAKQSVSPAEKVISFRQQALAIQTAGGGHLEVDFKIDDQQLDVLQETPSVKTLICDAGELTDAAIRFIGVLPKLQHLRLRLSPISDVGMQELAKCKTLWFLNLPHSDCTADGIAALAELPELRSIRIGSDRLEADAADAIALLKTVSSVHLIGVPINDEGLKRIASLPELESLYLDDSKVTEDGWQWLFDQHPTLHVHVNQQHHDRDSNQHSHGSTK
ncbi:MAG: hypothetical protein WBD20_21810 [Pirellulaceae bacterium]